MQFITEHVLGVNNNFLVYNNVVYIISRNYSFIYIKI